MQTKFPNVSCSQCGRDFGPGNSGFSDCRSHAFRDWFYREGCWLDAPTKEQCVDAQQRAFEAALASRPDAQADERGAHLSRTAGGHGIHGVPRAAFVPHTDSDRTDHCGSCGAENSPQTDDECPVCGAQNVLVSTWGNLQHDRYRNGLRYANNGPQWWEDGPQGDERGAVAELVKCSDMKGAQWYDIKVFDRTLPHGTKLYARATALQAEAAQGVADGWKLVPIKPTVEMLEAGARHIPALHVWAGMLDAAPAPVSKPEQPSQDEADLCERIIHAVEGECDGLAITEEQASNILAYLQYGAPMRDMPEAFHIVDNAIGATENYEPEGGNLRIVTLRIDAARKVRAALASALQAEAAQEQVGKAEPIAWIRFCGDGLYEGPIMNCDRRKMDEIVRVKPDEWRALVLRNDSTQENGCLTRKSMQEKALEHGFEYWRAPDEHGITGTKPQCIEFLQDLLGVEVEIEDNGCQTCNGTGMIGGPSFYAPDEGGEPCPDCCDTPSYCSSVRRCTSQDAEQPSDCGEQDCPHGVDDGACKQCYSEATRSAKGYSKEWCMRMAALEPEDGIPPAGIAASAPTLVEQGWPSDCDAAIQACALMIFGICKTEPQEVWPKRIEGRIRYMLSKLQPQAAELKGLTPEWLWFEFMDYCKVQGRAPSECNRLFEIVARARALLANGE